MQRDDHPEENSPEGARCTGCGAALPAGTRFCPECGAAVQRSIACPSCGEPVQAGERFCRYCGTQVAALTSRPPTPPSTSLGQSPTAPANDSETAGVPSSQSESDLRSAEPTSRPSYRPLAPFPITCPRCGARGAPTDAFCNSCGLPFDEQSTQDNSGEVRTAYGGLLIRLVARVIDSVIISSVFFAIVLVFGSHNFFYVQNEELIVTNTFYIIAALVPWAYHAGFLALWAATPGKRVMRVHIETVSGVSLGLWRPVLREAVIQAPSLLAIGGYETLSALSPLLLIASVVIGLSRPDRRMLHDLVAGTVAIRDRS